MLRRVQVTPEVRTQAKRLAYGILYGMGREALASELGVGTAEAGECMERFKEALPGVSAWIKGVSEQLCGNLPC